MKSEYLHQLSKCANLYSCRNENIISYKEAFMEDNILNIVMEFADGGDLLNKITKCKQNKTTISEKECWSLFI